DLTSYHASADRGGIFDDFNEAERLVADNQPARAIVRYRRTLRLGQDFWSDLIAARLVLACDAANQIDYSLAAAGRTTYTFDDNGNQQIVLEPNGNRTTNTWNYENQNTLVQLPTGSRVTMSYNADNRRVSKET
ncbi:MAG: hypothetical protein IH797_02250, partial [Chloroflexi bacterium]|nr:hypothetical protein [Chloroflexota bacterium]